ncbi:cytochrome P450 [Absidia repens]|uniref:Cytochrome P450 n=1 Tax=Absidia repens TaxID=90262 RepID=A0A1X2HZE4_9FUNG|nr:cytochrome P450 [Absidia repens]
MGTSYKRKAAYVTIGAAVVLLFRSIYGFYYVPKSLRHLPCVGYRELAYSIMKREDAATRARSVLGQAIKEKNGAFVAKFPMEWTVFLTSPRTIQAVLLKSDKFPKTYDMFHALGESSPFVKFLGIKNVGFSNGDDWKRQRKVMNPAFQRSVPVEMFGKLMQKGILAIEKQGYEVRALDFFERITLDSIGIFLFSFDFGSLDNPNSVWSLTYDTIRRGIKNPALTVFPQLDCLLKYVTPGRRHLDQCVTKLNNLLMEVAKEKRRQVQSPSDKLIPDSEKDLLTLILEAELRGDGSASDEELRGNLALFFLAGHETTASAMCFCLYNLAMNKDIQEKARKEVLEVLGDEPVDVRPDIQDLKQFRYMDMILHENLRRFGPAAMLLPRKSEEDFVADGILIPKNTPVVIDLNTMHHNPQVWKDPEIFDPERFAPGGEYEANGEKMAWLPFSSGSRVCIGKSFSMAEQRVFLSMLLKKYEWDFPDDSIHRDGIKMENFENNAPESLSFRFHPRY